MLKKLYLIFMILILTSCGLLGTKEKVKKGDIVVNVDAKLIYNDETVELKKGEGVELPENSFIIQSTGYMPLYVIPLEQTFNKNEINLVKISPDYIGKDLSKILRGNLSEALFKIHEIQGNIYSKRADIALDQIKDFEKEYGKIAFITYLKATAFYLKRDNLQAKDTLSSLSDDEKENKMVKTFLDRLQR